jgi:hypothetical protein
MKYTPEKYRVSHGSRGQETELIQTPKYLPGKGSRSAESRSMLTSRICEPNSRLQRPRFRSRSTLTLRSSVSALDGRRVPAL